MPFFSWHPLNLFLYKWWSHSSHGKDSVCQVSLWYFLLSSAMSSISNSWWGTEIMKITFSYLLTYTWFPILSNGLSSVPIIMYFDGQMVLHWASEIKFQLATVFLACTQSSLGRSLLPGTGCFGLTLDFPCLILAISHFSKEPGSFLEKMVFKTKIWWPLVLTGHASYTLTFI